MALRWKCTDCGKLLGTIKSGKVHIRIKTNQYVAMSTGTTMVQAVCPKCWRLNEVTVPREEETNSTSK